MTVAATLTSVQYVGNGSATQFSFNNKIFAAADLVVTLFDLNGNPFSFLNQSNTALGLSYTVQNVDVDTGCLVVFNAPPALNWTIDIRTDTPELQSTSIKNQGAFLPELHEEAFDKLTRIVQDDFRQTYLFGIHGPDTESIPWPALPGPLARANTTLGFGPTGLPSLAVPLQSALTQTQFNALLAASQPLPQFYPTTQAEINAGLTPNNAIPLGNLQRYGLVANNPSAATQNSASAQALFNYAIATGPTGYFFFPNATGTDTYYFNNPIVVRGGCHIDLNGCTLNYSGQVPAGSSNSGLFLLVHDFILENGTISCACDVSLAPGSGCALFVGGRDITGLITIFDSLLPAGGSLGRGVIRNLTIQMNNVNTTNNGSVGIGMLGGISNLIVENVTIDCGSTVAYGIQYEWGWATNQPTISQRQTSHAHNMDFRNLRILNCGTQDNGSGAGLTLGGAYSCTVDDLYVVNAPQAFNFYVGSALFYNPWAGVDTQGAKRNITLRNIVGQGITATGINLQGANVASGFLSAVIAALGHPFDYAAQTDLMHFSVDSFSIGGPCTGLFVSGPCDIRNGFLNCTGGSGSIIISDECTRFTFDDIEVRDNTAAMGIRAQFGDAIWNPPRPKVGSILNSLIAGNNATGIQIGNGKAVRIANCRIGYNASWDVANETVQTTGVQVLAGTGGSGASAGGVTCEDCLVTVPGGGLSYVISGTAAQTNNLVFPKGTIVGALSGWAVNGVSQATQTQLAAAGAAVNVYDKFFGRMAYNSSTTKLFVAQGAVTTSTWISVDGATTITPS